MGVRLKHPACTTDIKTDCIRRVREATQCSPAEHHAERSSLSLQFFQLEKVGENQLPSALESLHRSPCSDLTPRGLQGNLGAQLLGISPWHGKGEGLAIISTWILANQIYTCNVQVVIPTSSFAHLWNWVGMQSDQGIRWDGDLPIWMTRESRQTQTLLCSLTWVGNQARSPIQMFSATGTHPLFLFSELEQLPCPRIDYNSRPHLPKVITSKHIQKSQLSWLVMNCLCKANL